MTLYFSGIKFFPKPNPACHLVGQHHDWECYEVRRPFLAGSRVKYASLWCNICRHNIELWYPTIDGLSLFDKDMMTRAANSDRVLAAFIQTFNHAAMVRGANNHILFDCDDFRQSFHG